MSMGMALGNCFTTPSVSSFSSRTWLRNSTCLVSCFFLTSLGFGRTGIDCTAVSVPPVCRGRRFVDRTPLAVLPLCGCLDSLLVTWKLVWLVLPGRAEREFGPAILVRDRAFGDSSGLAGSMAGGLCKDGSEMFRLISMKNGSVWGGG
jgi:hypothetical protein